MMQRLCQWLSRRLRVTEQGHLLHADGSLYMGRWEFFRSRLFWPRLHYIATPDLDRHLHDHPASFFSLVLAGGYAEERPATIDPCFRPDVGKEATIKSWRGPGSFAFRRACDRHKISYVLPNTYTLFIFFGGKQHWWGFYTPAGKIFWKDYPSYHEAGPPIGVDGSGTGEPA